MIKCYKKGQINSNIHGGQKIDSYSHFPFFFFLFFYSQKRDNLCIYTTKII